MEKENAYMERKIDYKKIWLLFWKRAWLIAVFVVVFAIIAAGAYNVYRMVTSEGERYRVSSDYYITFNEDENGVDYYNAYTWDTILRDDPIVDVVMELLGDSVSRDEVKAVVTGEMLGDYRILTVHVTSKDSQFAQTVAEAYTQGLAQFADKISMLDTIEVWSRSEVAPVIDENLTVNAAILGAVLGFFLGVIYFMIYYVLDDSIYVEKDFTDRFAVPFLGMVSKGKPTLCKRELEQNMAYLLKEDAYYLVFADGKTHPADVEEFPVKGILSLHEDDLETLRKSNGAILMIPWGNKNGNMVAKTMAFLEKQDCEVAGAVIYDADGAFLKKYYGVS